MKKSVSVCAVWAQIIYSLPFVLGNPAIRMEIIVDCALGVFSKITTYNWISYSMDTEM